jgi:diaminohydroxyphosphoribosylaminopyrimidine deaminase/5-amino-6-(5-phosphoribosylamino)uracil reductase
VWVLTTSAGARRRAALEALGVEVIAVPGRASRVEVPSALRLLRRLGIWSLMVEGGSDLLGSFLAARAFDEVALFRAPLILGGRGSLGAFGGPDAARLAGAARLEPAEDPLVAPRDGLFELWRRV